LSHFSQVSQSITGGQDKQQQVQVKQLQSLLEKTRGDLAAEKAAVALSNKEAAKLRVLLKVGMSTPISITTTFIFRQIAITSILL